MSNILIVALLFSAVRLSTPLLLAALGGLYSERSGVINIALEGLMLAGAFTAATVTYYSGNAGWLRSWAPLISPWIGLAAAILAGVLVALVHGVACIRFKADQVVSGTAINILFLGIPALLSGALFDSTGATPHLHEKQLIPNLPIWLAFLLVPVTWYVLYRMPFGLRLRAVGENPEAADTAGVDVSRLRYLGVMLSGALAGIGGAYLSIGQSSLFTRNMTSGRGFIALAALIFGKWRPVQTMLACLLFGFAEALSIQMQGAFLGDVPLLSSLMRMLQTIFPSLGSSWEKWQMPVQFIQLLPYVLTIVVLAGFIGHSRAPRALGIPYQKKR